MRFLYLGLSWNHYFAARVASGLGGSRRSPGGGQRYRDECPGDGSDFAYWLHAVLLDGRHRERAQMHWFLSNPVASPAHQRDSEQHDAALRGTNGGNER